MSTLRLSDLIQERLQAAPDAPLFIHQKHTITAREFADLVHHATGWLRSHGVSRGDKVALWLTNRVEWLTLLAAIARIGAITVSVNTRYRSEELTHILASSGARLLIMQDRYKRLDFLEILQQVDANALPRLEKIAVLSDTSARPAQPLPWPVLSYPPDQAAPDHDVDTSSADDVTILFSTSGTTKAPKLVMQSQRALVDHAHRCAAGYGLDQPQAVLLCMLPLCGVFGLNSVLAAMAGTATIVLQEAFDAAEAVDLLVEHRVTHTYGSDEMYRRIAELAPGERPFPHARMFGFGAFTSSFTEYAMRCIQRGMPLVGLYGSSEVLAMFSAQSATLPVEQRLQGGGQPVAGREASIRIRDTVTGELLPPNHSGEIEILAPSHFIGYFQDPEATAAAHLDGHFRTGDLGYLRDDGSLVFETRMGDAMRLGGHLVSPVEIEEVIKRVPGVQDAHVVAVDIEGQPRPVAFVIPLPGRCPPTTDVVADFLRPILAGFKIPARVWAIAEAPQTEGTNGGKTSRVQLRKMAQERLNVETEGVIE